MNNAICLLLLSSIIRVSNLQYVNNNRKLVSQKSCDGSKTALVEHFFNLIFSEFHNTPPICVCVQMCVGQSTYCYPNGCLDKSKARQKTIEDNNVQYSSSPSDPIRKAARKKPIIFLFDENNDQMTHFSADYFVNERQREKPEMPTNNELHMNAFDDRYKTFNKFKKVPKIKFKYNLREQVKNKKLDLLKHETMDVTKTRWPLSKRVQVNGQRIYSENNNINRLNRLPKINKVTKSFQQERDPIIAKYFKRESRNRRSDNVDMNVISFEKMEPEIDNVKFSLESLIDNLMDKSPEVTNKSNIELNIQFIDPFYNETSGAFYSNFGADNIVNVKNVNTNETTINDTNHFNNKTVFTEENYITMLNNMISTISNNIDEQNSKINTTILQGSVIERNLGPTTETNIKHKDFKAKSIISEDTT